MGYDTLLWIVIMAAAAVIELMTASLVSIWFVVGGLAAFLLSLTPADAFAQWLVFALVSLTVLVLFRGKIAAKLRKRHVATNADSVIGKVVPLRETVDNENETGLLVLGDQEWTARAEKDTDVIPKGELVRVLRIEGVKLIVKPEKKEEKEQKEKTEQKEKKEQL